LYSTASVRQGGWSTLPPANSSSGSGTVEPVTKAADAMFVVPPGFHRADPVRDDTQKAPIQTLSMQPSGQ